MQLIHLSANPAGNVNAKAITLIHLNGVTSHSVYGITLISVVAISHQKKEHKYHIPKLFYAFRATFQTSINQKSHLTSGYLKK